MNDGSPRNPPRLVTDADGLPKVMDESDVLEHLGKTRAVAGRRNSMKMYLPLHTVDATMDILRGPLLELLEELGIPLDVVIQTFRCGRRDGIAQITLGSLLDANK